MINLRVWLRAANGSGMTLAGRLVTTEPTRDGAFEAEFAYDGQFDRARGQSDLDPASLPRGSKPTFRGVGFAPPLGVFEDALPDAWGQRLMRRRLVEIGVRPSKPQMLRHLGGGGLGALVFHDGERDDEPRPVEAVDSLDELLEAADKFERNDLKDDDKFRRLLQAGGTAGGARPKALIVDHGAHWIAKFPSATMDEGNDIVGLEAVSMELARRAGLQAADSRLETVGSRRVLLVRRFDVTASGGRRHMVSFKTLCREKPGVSAMGYEDLAVCVRKYSAAPGQDLRMLFRQAVFNAAIGNVDDHTKNFWMVLDERGWRISPAFDLLPDFSHRVEHSLAFDLSPSCPDRSTVDSIAQRWGIAFHAPIIDQVIESVSGFAALAREMEVQSAITPIAEDIQNRLQRLSSPSPRRNARP